MATKRKERWIVRVVSNHSLARRILEEILAREHRFDVRTATLSRESGATSTAAYVIDSEGTSPISLTVLRSLRDNNPMAKFVAVADDVGGLALPVHISSIDGLVLEHAVRTDLIPAVHAVLRGRTSFPLRKHEVPPTVAGVDSLDALTKRERVVYALLLHRLQNKEIAAELGVKESTVKSHVASVLSKLGAASRRDLALERRPL